MSDPRCAWCREPFDPMGEPQRFCVTCDQWVHLGCLERHAPCEPDGEGDWRHRGPPEGAP
jgi:hypothetical protein